MSATRADWQRAVDDAAWQAIGAIEDKRVQNGYVMIYYDLAMASSNVGDHKPRNTAYLGTLASLFLKQMTWSESPPDGVMHAHRAMGFATLTGCLAESNELESVITLARAGILEACDAVGAETALRGIGEWIDLGNGAPEVVQTLLCDGVDLFEAFEKAKLLGN